MSGRVRFYQQQGTNAYYAEYWFPNMPYGQDVRGRESAAKEGYKWYTQYMVQGTHNIWRNHNNEADGMKLEI